MDVHVLSKKAFIKRMKDLEVHDGNVAFQRNMYFITIDPSFDTDEPGFFEERHHNVLQLRFDDVSSDFSVPLVGSDGKESITAKTMTPEQADEVIRFMDMVVDEAGDAAQLVIHCTLGKHRSMAIGIFLNVAFGANLVSDNTNYEPNKMVLDLLRSRFKTI